jgi:hypothetical protein
LASVGHEANCDQQNLTSTKVSVVSAEEGDYESDKGSDAERRSDAFVAHMSLNPMPSQPSHDDSADLSKACSMLAVVQDLTSMILETDPHVDPCTAVQNVICSLANHEHEQQVYHDTSPQRDIGESSSSIGRTGLDGNSRSVGTYDNSYSDSDRAARMWAVDKSTASINDRSPNVGSSHMSMSPNVGSSHMSMSPNVGIHSNFVPILPHAHSTASTSPSRLLHARRKVMAAYGWRTYLQRLRLSDNQSKRAMNVCH